MSIRSEDYCAGRHGCRLSLRLLSPKLARSMVRTELSSHGRDTEPEPTLASAFERNTVCRSTAPSIGNRPKDTARRWHLLRRHSLGPRARKVCISSETRYSDSLAAEACHAGGFLRRWQGCRKPCTKIPSTSRQAEILQVLCVNHIVLILQQRIQAMLEIDRLCGKIVRQLQTRRKGGGNGISSQLHRRAMGGCVRA